MSLVLAPTFMTVDPGQRTGYAVWNRWAPKIGAAPIEQGGDEPPVGAGILRVNADKQCLWEHRCFMLTRALTDLVKIWEVEHVYCEYPAFFQSSMGMAAAVSGDLVKLSYLVGMYAGACCVNRDVSFTRIKVNDWKGQLPKEVVKRRIIKTLGKVRCDGWKGDTWDAVGIGLYVKGVF